MADSYVQVAADGAGKRLRTNSRTVNSLEVHEQYVTSVGPSATYHTQTASATAAANKIYWDLFNASGSGVDIVVTKLFVQPVFGTYTGALSTWEVRRTSAIGTGGTVLTPVKSDTADPNLPAQVTVRGLATGGATANGVFMNLPLYSEETSAGFQLTWAFNILAEGGTVKDIVCHPGEGLSVVQAAGAVGSFSVLGVFYVA